MTTQLLIQLRLFADRKQYAKLEQACLNVTPPAPAEVYPLLALGRAHLGKYKAARETMALVLKTKMPSKLDFDGCLDLAAAHLALLQLDEAGELLGRLLDQQPDHPLALARYGWCLMVMEKPDAAEDRFAKSAKLDPSRVPVWTNLATLALGREDIPAALNAVEKGNAALLKNRDDLPEDLFTAHLLMLDQLFLQCRVKQEAFAEAEAWLSYTQAKNPEGYYTARLTAYGTALAARDLHAQAEEALCQGLKRYPDNISLLVQRAELAGIQGHFYQAVQLLRRAISHDRDNSILWCQLSSVCLDRFNKEARHAAEKAVALAGAPAENGGQAMPRIRAGQCRAKTALAAVESSIGNFEVSEELFLGILEENPNFVPALQGLGQQYMHQGSIREALALYRRIEKTDPLKAHSAMIRSRRFPEDEAVLEKMEAAARTPSLEGRVKSGLLFQVAAAREKQKEYDRAFELADLANHAGRRFLTYDARAHRNWCFRVRERFSQGLFEHRKGCGPESALPVYVLGMPRSGTTLVEQIISGHSRIFGAGELGIIPQRIQGLNRWERHVGSGRAYPDCMDDLTPYISHGIAQGIIEELQAYDPQALHIVDKLPHNFENIGFIKFLFPNAKIISVRRDPRDIAVSNYFTDYQARHGGMGFAYDLTDIGKQLADHNMMMDHWHRLFPDEILEIRYEDVVDDLEGSARRILGYIGMDWEPRVLQFNTLDRPVKTASVWQVRQPIYKTSKNRWENYRSHLTPLIQGTNAKILPDPVEDMITLPEPGFLQNGVALFHREDLDGAELRFKKMLHHNPEHAACTYMVGLVYCNKGHLAEGADMMALALKKAPWHKEWRQNLIQVYDALGRTEESAALKSETETAGSASRAPLPPEHEGNRWLYFGD